MRFTIRTSSLPLIQNLYFVYDLLYTDCKLYQSLYGLGLYCTLLFAIYLYCLLNKNNVKYLIVISRPTNNDLFVYFRWPL